MSYNDEDGLYELLIQSRIDLDNYRDLVQRMRSREESLLIYINKLEKECKDWEKGLWKKEGMLESNILENLKYEYNEKFQN
jgi:hypothetical protein